MKNDRIEPDHFKRIKSYVRRRDSHKCQLCNKPQKGRGHVHHILPWETHPYLRYTATNLCLLCATCHKKVTGSECYWVKILMDKVQNNTQKYKGKKP